MILLVFLTNIALAGLSQLSLEMSKKDLRQFQGTIQHSLKLGYLHQASNPWRKGVLREGQRLHPIKFKLKGDLPKHWRDLHKSWALKLSHSSVDSVTDFSLTLAADKYFAIPLLIQEIYTARQRPMPATRLVELRTFPYPKSGLYLLEEELSESFREKSHLSSGDFYLPNNQWVLGLNNPRHPYASHFAKVQGSFHPMLSDCIFYRPRLRDEMNPKFCEFLSLMKTDPALAFEKFVEKESFLLWMAVMTYLGDTHSALVDNHGWYVNFLTETASPMPRDFIPTYPAFEDLNTYLDHLERRHPFFRHVLQNLKLREEFLTLLKLLLLRSPGDLEFLKSQTPTEQMNPLDKKSWSESLQTLSQWQLKLQGNLAKGVAP